MTSFIIGMFVGGVLAAFIMTLIFATVIKEYGRKTKRSK